jgi:hypothetical protein
MKLKNVEGEIVTKIEIDPARERKLGTTAGICSTFIHSAILPLHHKIRCW